MRARFWKERPTARVEKLTQSEVAGWFVPLNGVKTQIDIFIDGNCIAHRVSANGERSDVSEALLVPLAHSFSVAVALPDQKPVSRIVVRRTSDGSVMARQKVRISQAREREKINKRVTELFRRIASRLSKQNLHQIDGRVEDIRSGYLRGWAINTALSDELLQVELRLNGVPFSRGFADGERIDVEAAHPGHLKSGFAIPFEPELLPSGRHAVSVIALPSGMELRSKVPFVEGRGKTVAFDRLPENRPISIIVPVYNAPEDLSLCLDCLLRNTNLVAGTCEIILLDDASPDPAVQKVLDHHKDHPAIRIVTQTHNVGYTGNVNHGIELAGQADVVVLNSDARVGPGWLRRLRSAAARRSSIGTVTAVSDNAGAFSVPRIDEANLVPEWTDEEGWARLTMQTARCLHPSVPTGSGFCIFIKRALLDDVGPFSVDLFPRGYGEENELCMRAAQRGWEHVVADDAIVFHERSKSFKKEKDNLVRQASQKIAELYPEYRFLVRRDFQLGMGMSVVRHDALSRSSAPSRRPRPRIVFVIGIDTGGTAQTNMDLMSAIHEDYEPWLLLSDGRRMTLFRIDGSGRVEVERHEIEPAVEPIFHDSRSYRTRISDILQRFAFEIIHIRHIVFHGLSLIEAARSLSIPVVFSLHDYYVVCPTVKLLDGNGDFRPEDSDRTLPGREGRVELWSPGTVPTLSEGWLRNWQTRFARVLRSCDHLVTTSAFAKDFISERLGLDGVPFDVIEHGRDFAEMQRCSQPKSPDGPLRVLVPGDLSVAKGLALIEAIKDRDVANRIEFHFLGAQQRDVSSIGVVHGRYERDHLPELIKEIGPHVGAVLSVWPETYSHTITELWAAGVPVITSNLGAPGERLLRHGGGWVLEDLTPDSVYRTLLRIGDSPAEIAHRVEQVETWQNGYGASYSVAAMASRYIRIYDRLIRKGTARVIAVPFGAQPGITPDLQHLRELLGDIVDQPTISRIPEAAVGAFDTLGPVDAIVVQYSGEPERARNDILTKLAADVPLILDVQPDIDLSALQPGSAPSFFALAEVATRVIAPRSRMSQIVQFAPGRVVNADYGFDVAGTDAEHVAGLIDWARLAARPRTGYGATAILAPMGGAEPDAVPDPAKVETIVVRAQDDARPATIRVSSQLGFCASLTLGASVARGEFLVFGTANVIASRCNSLVKTLKASPTAAVAVIDGSHDGATSAFAIRTTDWAKLRGLRTDAGWDTAVVDLISRAEMILKRGSVQLPSVPSIN